MFCGYLADTGIHKPADTCGYLEFSNTLLRCPTCLHLRQGQIMPIRMAYFDFWFENIFFRRTQKSADTPSADTRRYLGGIRTFLGWFWGLGKKCHRNEKRCCQSMRGCYCPSHATNLRLKLNFLKKISHPKCGYLRGYLRIPPLILQIPADTLRIPRGILQIPADTPCGYLGCRYLGCRYLAETPGIRTKRGGIRSLAPGL